MSFLPGMMRGRGGVPLALTYIGSASSTTDSLTTYDFGDFTAPEAGLMIVAALGRGSSVVTSISIGGSNGTIHVNPDGPSNSSSAIASRVVGAGAQNVSVTFPGTATVRAGVFVWLLTGYLSATPNGTDSENEPVTDGITEAVMTLDILAGGIAVYANQHVNAGTVTWSSATERADFSIEASQMAAADKATQVLLTAHVETADWTTDARRGSVAASWR
ncbi:MAG: hypothetical protein WD674_08905 [Cucumibacter sp.]